MSKALAIIASNAPSELEYVLEKDGFEVLRIPPSPFLDTPVQTHADMLIFPIADTVFCHESFAKENADIISKFSEYGYKTRAIGGEYRKEYPHDVRFNAALVGKHLFIGARTDANEICEYAQNNGFSVTRVNQGYTKCSTCIIRENAIITADMTIEKAAKEHGIDVLRIQEGHVDLFGYSHGFIGGASGAFDDVVYFVGDVKLHPNGDAILEFCKKHDKKISNIENRKLFDIGSIIFLPTVDFN